MDRYSPLWYETFSGPAVSADREVAFLQRHLPCETHPKVLDLLCGTGRVTNAAARAGYHAIGLDVNPEALARARARSVPGAEFVEGDVRDLGSHAAAFDGVLCLWQSFGMFDDTQNQSVLLGMARCLRSGGRVVMDVYNREALAQLPSHERFERAGHVVTTRRTLEGQRFRVHIRYEDADVDDRFQWIVYSPAELTALGRTCGLAQVIECAWFDDTVPPSPQHTRMQMVFSVE